ncbi:MAG: GxxExxY protein [Spirochaetales bacterium]|uniref:GxxExxY protein n=1 Tax=Candidatus Thalassospirochaeta sargassi TaxID=3119039 RepID=A0AAJ1IJ71_9SPIO|nr:GxxExxY protein [Spirochaetales bacterium]
MIHKELGYQIVGCCMEVHSHLGPGLLEQCYHNALYFELTAQGLQVAYNRQYDVLYKGQQVGEYFADLVVENNVIIELKSVKALASVHAAQVLNYLHISDCRLGLLVNFQGSSLEWQRLVV